MPFSLVAWIWHLHASQGSEIMSLWLQVMYLWLRFSPEASYLLFREQGPDSPDQLHVLTDKNVDDICNIMRKQDGRNTNRMPD